ncbi:MAG: hypothetical protein KJ787_05335 [Gammaproteobacteria bacterium]|nr:hypothetical protein [Gammaproteobacteria bacterium]MBU1645734.1 hypothetical protein [Gammaproteobacteria bacterium]MBU1971242.1 hypothetical protein [Gammaproteobacteria bacterium]
MLLEAWEWLRTPCSRQARRLGYLGEAIAFAGRHRRCAMEWREHLTQCHSAVRKSLACCTGHRTALVMGAGLALEYPLAELAARFDRVILADMVHLRPLRDEASRHANVLLLEADITAISRHLVEGGDAATPGQLEAWSRTTPSSPLDPQGIDWVLSANLLSQLPLLPVAWLSRHRPELDDAFLENLGRNLMQGHLDLLASFDGERCLIADAEHRLLDDSDKPLEHSDFAAAFGLDEHAYASWLWPIAPPGELARGWRREHRMVACHWPGGTR